MADKKISELPLIQTISGSTVVVPMVHDGTTIQIPIQRLSLFTSQFSATTGSNTFIGNQIISGNLSVSGLSTLTGNTSIGGNLVVNGKLTAQEIYTEITSASIIFESGSTKFGDDTGDKHEFTGSINVSGSVIYNGVILTNIDANTIQKLQQTTASLNFFTASQIGKDGTLAEVTSSLRYFYQTTSSLHAFTASQIGKDDTLAEVTSSLRYFYQTTSSIHAFTASQLGQVDTLSIFTSSINAFTGSQIGKDGTLAEVTSSLRYFYQTTSSIHAFTASQIGKDGTLAILTSSIDAHILKQATQTGSQDLVNLGISSITGSLIGITNTLMGFTASLDNTYATDAQLYQLYQATASIQFTTRSLNLQTGSQDLVNLAISTYTGSQNVINSSVDSHILKQATQTGSQDLVNLGISSVTGSLIGITNGLMAFTAALDSTYATDAQLYQLYQATASIQFATASLNTQTGSQSNLNAQIGIATSSLNSVSASLIGITNGLMAFTAALDSTYATDAQLYQLYQATASIHFTTQSLNTQTGSQNTINFNISVVTSSIDVHILKQATQTGSQDLVNLGISTFTGSQNVINTSVDAHILKQAIQTGSQDLVNYNISVVTSSIDSHILKQATQTGSQDLVNLGISTFTGSLRSEVNLIEAYTASLKGAIEVSGQNVNVLGMITAQQFNVTYVSSSVMYRSGSTEFGDSSDDRHLFTGSLIVSGTLAAGTDETGWGRISFNEPTNTLRIQSSKNGTDCIPISFWSQRTGGTFAESMTISGSNIGIGISSPNLSGGASGTTVLTLSATTSARNALLELNGTRTNATDVTGYLRFFNNSAATPLADIRALRGSSDTAGELEFQTANVGRMKITEGGILEMRPITFSSVANNAVQTVIPSMGKGTWLVSVANDVDSSDGYSAMLWVRTNEIIEMQVFRADSMVFSYTNQDLKIQNTSGFTATLYVTAIRMAAS